MRMLGDLGGMLGQMTPEAQKRNLHRIFTRIELNNDGEAVRVEVKPWVRRAFEPILTSPPELTTNIMPKVGVNHNLWTRCSGGLARWSRMMLSQRCAYPSVLADASALTLPAGW